MSEQPHAGRPNAEDACQIVLLQLPQGRSPQRAFAELARVMGASLSEARTLASRLPITLPPALSLHEAENWRAQLDHAGFAVRLSDSEDAAEPTAELEVRCHDHVKHVSTTVCGECKEQICRLCELRAGAALCAECVRRRARKHRFFLIRVGILLSVLVVVIARGGIDYLRRQERRAWQRPLEVGLILLEQSDVDARAVAHFRARVDALEEALEAEFFRYGGEFHPIRFRQFGPVRHARLPPRARAEASPLEPLLMAFELWRFARDNDRAAAVSDAGLDGKVYVLLSAPSSQKRALVEGLSEDGGRIAVTRVELSEDSVDFGLVVVAHELLHLLGATDRYDASGSSILPDGLAEPDRVPLYPQRRAEVMARGRVLGPGAEVPPAQLDELCVGALTAREIGWTAADESAGSH